VPTPHNTHAVWADPDAYEPAGHPLQLNSDAPPRWSLYFPAAQLWHAPELTDATPALNFP